MQRTHSLFSVLSSTLPDVIGCLESQIVSVEKCSAAFCWQVWCCCRAVIGIDQLSSAAKEATAHQSAGPAYTEFGAGGAIDDFS